MDNIELYFRDPNSGDEVVRNFPVSTIDDAFQSFRDEFPDESKRPRVFKICVEHLTSDMV